MAPKSSKIATDSKNSFNEIGTRLPKRLKTPKANAISVAEGIAQPRTDISSA